jgi:hypothetical protein
VNNTKQTAQNHNALKQKEVCDKTKNATDGPREAGHGNKRDRREKSETEVHKNSYSIIIIQLVLFSSLFCDVCTKTNLDMAQQKMHHNVWCKKYTILLSLLLTTEARLNTILSILCLLIYSTSVDFLLLNLFHHGKISL